MSDTHVNVTALRVGSPEMNRSLRRIYQCIPSIGIWARSGVPNELWLTGYDALMGIQEMIGPMATSALWNSLHLTPADKEFLASPEALNAIFAVIQQIYERPNTLVAGLFPEASPA